MNNLKETYKGVNGRKARIGDQNQDWKIQIEGQD